MAKNLLSGNYPLTVGTQNLHTYGDVVATGHGRFRIEKGYDPSVRVPDFVPDCVGFVGVVEHRDSSGGVSGDLCATGFFVSVPCESPELPGVTSFYFVTAKHVVIDELAKSEPYFLVNKIGGGTLTISSVMNNEWWFHPTDTTADVAVAQVANHRDAQIMPVHVTQLGTPQRLQDQDIGIGDEVFLTGLFTPAPGLARNIPIVRHGNVAMMAGEEIQTDLGYASVHLVEIRSIGGISGSPVFVRPTIHVQTPPPTKPDGKGPHLLGVGHGTTLLGLMHGHWDIKESEMNKAFFDQDRKRGVNMGIGIVVPAIKILETLMRPELVEVRRLGEKALLRRMVPGMDSSKTKEPKEQQFTQNDFEAALKKASRKIGTAK